jgi:hypothetical protein
MANIISELFNGIASIPSAIGKFAYDAGIPDPMATAYGNKILNEAKTQAYAAARQKDAVEMAKLLEELKGKQNENTQFEAAVGPSMRFALGVNKLAGEGGVAARPDYSPEKSNAFMTDMQMKQRMGNLLPGINFGITNQQDNSGFNTTITPSKGGYKNSVGTMANAMVKDNTMLENKYVPPMSAEQRTTYLAQTVPEIFSWAGKMTPDALRQLILGKEGRVVDSLIKSGQMLSTKDATDLLVKLQEQLDKSYSSMREEGGGPERAKNILTTLGSLLQVPMAGINNKGDILKAMVMDTTPVGQGRKDIDLASKVSLRAAQETAAYAQANHYSVLTQKAARDMEQAAVANKLIDPEAYKKYSKDYIDALEKITTDPNNELAVEAAKSLGKAMNLPPEMLESHIISAKAGGVDVPNYVPGKGDMTPRVTPSDARTGWGNRNGGSTPVETSSGPSKDYITGLPANRAPADDLVGWFKKLGSNYKASTRWQDLYGQ